jgi:hypothetical protein
MAALADGVLLTNLVQVDTLSSPIGPLPVEFNWILLANAMTYHDFCSQLLQNMRLRVPSNADITRFVITDLYPDRNSYTKIRKIVCPNCGACVLLATPGFKLCLPLASSGQKEPRSYPIQ